MVRKGTRRAAQEVEVASQNVEEPEMAAPVKATKKNAAKKAKKSPDSSSQNLAKKQSLINLFDKIQHGKMSDENAMAILTHLYSQANGSIGTGGEENSENKEPSENDFNELIFGEVMNSIILQNFQITIKSVPVERTLKLVAQFVCHCLDKELNYVDNFAWIIKTYHDDVNKSYRHRVCQLILMVMTKCANDEIDLPDNLWKLMRDTLIVRSRDKFNEVVPSN